jgi:hypothetical protein
MKPYDNVWLVQVFSYSISYIYSIPFLCFHWTPCLLIRLMTHLMNFHGFHWLAQHQYSAHPGISGHSLVDQKRHPVNTGAGQSLRDTRDIPAHPQEKRRRDRHAHLTSVRLHAEKAVRVACELDVVLRNVSLERVAPQPCKRS